MATEQTGEHYVLRSTERYFDSGTVSILNDRYDFATFGTMPLAEECQPFIDELAQLRAQRAVGGITYSALQVVHEVQRTRTVPIVHIQLSKWHVVGTFPVPVEAPPLSG